MFETEEESIQETDNYGHRLNLIAEFDIDSTSNVELRTNTSFGSGDLLSSEMSDVFRTGNVYQSNSLTDYLSNAENFDFEGDLYFRKRFGAKRGRSFTANLDLNSGDDENECRNCCSRLKIFLNTGNSFYLDQTQGQVTDNMNWGARLSYTEPIGKKQMDRIQLPLSRRRPDVREGRV